MTGVSGKITQKNVTGFITQKNVRGHISQMNVYGMISQGGYYAGSAHCPQYQPVYDAFLNKPSSPDDTRQNTMLQALVTLGVYSKAEFLDVFFTHSNTGGESQINWHNPGTFNPVQIGSGLTWEQYGGFTGAATKAMNLMFNPTVNGSLIGQNNICIIIGVGSNVSSNLIDFGGYDGSKYIYLAPRRTTNLERTYLNNATAHDLANTNSIKHYAISRGDAAGYDKYLNLVKTQVTAASTGLLNVNLYACGNNNNGALGTGIREIYYVFCFSYLTEAEVTGTIAIMNNYFTNYGKQLY